MSKKKELFSIYPLPASLKQEKQKLKSEVGNFWHNASFVHGWAAPAFLYHDVKAEVDEACDMVVRIRAHCQRKFPEMRTGPGASAEFLWSQQHKPEDKQKFVDQLVEAILSNADGFEPPLDKALVDRYIATIREMRKQATEVKASHVLKSEWEASELLLDEVLEASGHVNESEILAVVDKLRELNVVLEGITNRQRADAEAAAKKEKEEAQRAEEEMARKVEEAKKRQQEQEEAARKAASEAEKKHEDAEEAEEEDDSEDSTSSDERKRMKASMDRALASKGKLIELKKIDMQTQKIASDVKSFEEVDLPRLDDANLSDAERDGLISRLHKRAMQYAHVLESELLALDAISGGDDVRALRKEQVSKVQKAIDEVDKLQKRLKELHVAHGQQVEEKRAAQTQAQAQAEEEKPADKPAEKPAEKPVTPQQSSSPGPRSSPPPAVAEAQAVAAPVVAAGADRAGEIVKPPTFAERLVEQRLEIQFQVKDRPSSFLISAYVPGVDENTLSIALSDDGDMLTCSGVRLPSPQEMQVLRSHPAVVRYPPHLREDAALRLAAGRFGRFEEKWRMDRRTVDAEKVTASYNSGVIEIVVPKKHLPRQPYLQQQQQQRRNPYMGNPYQNPYYW